MQRGLVESEERKETVNRALSKLYLIEGEVEDGNTVTDCL